MRQASNNEDEFNESGEDQEQVINAEASIIDETSSEDAKKYQAGNNPFTANQVNTKSYAKSNTKIADDLLNTPIEEPRIIPPPPPPPPTMDAPKVEKPFNPELKDLDAKEKNTAAARAADMAIQMYVWLHQLGNKALQISNRKLDKLQQQGLVDLSVPVNYNGAQMTIYQLIGMYNQANEGVLEVSEEFKAKVKPLLIQIFEKKGVGLTPEQELVFIVAQDMTTKAAIVYVVMQQKKDMINAVKDNTAAFRDYVKNGGNATPPPPPPSSSVNHDDLRREETSESAYHEQVIYESPIQQHSSGVPGEINAQGFVTNAINPDNVPVQPTDERMVRKQRNRNNSAGESKSKTRRKNKLV